MNFKYFLNRILNFFNKIPGSGGGILIFFNDWYCTRFYVFIFTVHIYVSVSCTKVRTIYQIQLRAQIFMYVCMCIAFIPILFNIHESSHFMRKSRICNLHRVLTYAKIYIFTPRLHILYGNKCGALIRPNCYTQYDNFILF